MKAYIIQPRYSTDYKQLNDCILEELELLEQCDEGKSRISCTDENDFKFEDIKGSILGKFQIVINFGLM